MLSRMKGHQGFTLIELMIVVAIIGILAAIAIPNFLQYQMKARQTEARTNVMGIKTSMVSYAGTAGCNPSITTRPAAAPTPAKVAWGVPLALVPTLCQPAGLFTGGFDDIGFVPSGNVFYQYGVSSQVAAVTIPLAPSLAAAVGRNACAVVAAPLVVTAGAAINGGFQVEALGDLDGNAIISHMSADDGTGATDCTPGIF
jgi:type IV pilus assembly protein PilA